MNNNDIISNIINKINEKKDVKNNVINYFFNDNNNIDNIFPLIKYKDSKYSNYNKFINIPINKFKNINLYDEEKDINIGDDYIYYTNNYDNILLSEQDVINKNILNNNELINSNTNKDIQDFLNLSNDIIKYSDNYKNELNNISGKNFETLFANITQGNNYKNILSLEHIPFDKIKEQINNEYDEKSIANYLKNKKIFKYNYEIFKKFYSTKNYSKTLYDIYNLSDKNRDIYLDNISVYGGYGITKEKKYVSSKTDITISFFVLDKKYGNIKNMLNNAEKFKDTLNISLKEDDYYGYQNIRSSGENIIKDLFNKILDMSNIKIAKNVITDLNYKLLRLVPIDVIEEINILITHKNSSNLDNYVISDKKLKDFCPGEKKVLVKFMYGSFVNYQANANAFLSVKNKSDVSNINKILNLIQPIDFYNQDLISYLENLNVIYNYTVKNLFNIKKRNSNYDKTKIIYNKKLINTEIKKYLFKSEDDIYNFIKQLHFLIIKNNKNNVSFNKVKNSLYKAIMNNSNLKVFDFINIMKNSIKVNGDNNEKEKQNYKNSSRNSDEIKK